MSAEPVIGADPRLAAIGLGREIFDRLVRFANEDPIAGGDPIGLPFDPVLLSADVAAALRVIGEHASDVLELRNLLLNFHAEMEAAEDNSADEKQASDRFFDGITDLLDDAGVLTPEQQISLGLLEGPDDDDECDEDPAVCDCAFHENARRAEASHDDDDDADPEPRPLVPPRCEVCGCTDDKACVAKGFEPDDPDGACMWIAPNLCSECIGSYNAGSKPLPRLLQSNEGAETGVLFDRLKGYGTVGNYDLAIAVRRGEASVESALGAASMRGAASEAKRHAQLAAHADARWAAVRTELIAFHAAKGKLDGQKALQLVQQLTQVFGVEQHG